MNLVAFNLLDKEYALPVEQVVSVLRMQRIISVPETACFVEGVINLRGKIVTVINLKKKFGLNEPNINNDSRIIITICGSHYTGIIVDKVNDVVNFDRDSVQPPDDILKETGYLLGVARIGQRITLIINAEKILSKDEQSNINRMHEQIEIRKV